MILLWGISTDPPMTAVRTALAATNAQVLFFDQQRAPESRIELSADATVTGVLRCPAGAVALEDVTAVYLRPYETRRLLATVSTQERAIHLDSALAAWTELTGALVVNRLSAMGSNGSKPYQASLIWRLGMEVPQTLVTTDPQAAAEFWSQHGAVVYKSISGVRSIVARLSESHRDRLKDVCGCPTQFQEYVEGVDVRVHVVGDELFACEIECKADDYRYAGRLDAVLCVKACRLSDEMETRCRSLVAGLGLLVAGIDLRRRPDGRWCCFEVNPSPGFTYYAGAAGQPIAEALARLLSRS